VEAEQVVVEEYSRLNILLMNTPQVAAVEGQKVQ
jgi:hypothetical protein